MVLSLHSKAACGSRVQAAPKASRPAVVRAAVVVKAQANQEVVSMIVGDPRLWPCLCVECDEDPRLVQDRRAALGFVAGAAAMLAGASPSQAAFGDSANVFGKITNKSGFVPYAGNGYAFLLPTKWNPSKEKEYPGVEVRSAPTYSTMIAWSLEGLG